MSALGIPQIAVVMGSCTAGGAYVPAMSDETIIVRKQGTIFLGGPPLVKAATGEVVSAEDLGGADVHARKSGVADHYAADDDHALAIARRIVGQPQHARSRSTSRCMRRARAAATIAAELDGIVPADLSKQYDVREVIARLVDGSEFDEFKQLYGTTLVTGFAHLHGMPVGILGNNGILFSESALKAAHFIELCCQRRIPLLFLQNIIGFMVGRELRGRRHRQGRRQDGDRGRLRAACRRSRVIIGGSLRRRQLRHVRPRLRPALPVHVAERAHLGDGRRAGGERARDRAARQYRGATAATGARRRRRHSRRRSATQYEREGNPYYATARLWDDGIIAAGRDAARAGAGVLGGAQCAGAGDEVRRVPDVTGRVTRPIGRIGVGKHRIDPHTCGGRVLPGTSASAEGGNDVGALAVFAGSW